jgi:hypothetical protein
MSSVVIAGDTSGSITLDAPAVAGTTVLTLPATSGTVLTTTSPKVGNVIQVVQGTLSSMFSTTSTSFVDTGLSATITPSSASSKILVLIHCWAQIDAAANNGMGFNVLRNSTQAYTTTVGYNYVYWNNGGQNYTSQAISFLDSPATTSSITYKFQIGSNVGGIVGLNRNTPGVSTSYIQLLEVAA